MSNTADIQERSSDGCYRDIAIELILAKARAARAEAELDAIRSSNSWRLTAPLRAFVVWLDALGKDKQVDSGQPKLAAPKRLPLQLCRLDLPPISSDGVGRVVDGRPLLADALPPGFQSILDGRGERGKFDAAGRRDMPVIAFWGNIELYRELMFCGDVAWLDEIEWASRLDEVTPEFVLLAPDARNRAAEAEGWIGRMIEACHQRGIPVAAWIWDVEDGFAQSIASRASAIFVLCKAAKQSIAGRFPSMPVFIAPPAIATTLYNPIRTLELQRLSTEMEGVAISDTLSDALEEPGLLRIAGLPLLYESYWNLPASRLADEMTGQGSVLGVLRPEDKVAVWKAGACEILSESPRKPRWWNDQQALRIAACGARMVRPRPISLGAGAGDPEDGLARSGAPLARLREMANAHRAMRDALKADLVVRMGEMRLCLGGGRDPGGRADNRGEELVSCLLVSKRPELAMEAVGAMLGQTYARLEVVLLLHGVTDEAASGIESRFRERVRVLSAPTSWSLGRCLNEAFAASRGTYWLKIDDDDIYGVRYVQDMMLHAGRLDHDLVGKPLVFTLFEQDDALYFDAEMAAFSNTIHRGGWPRGVVCGATLGGRRGVLERQGFPADRRHGIDSLFLDECANHGMSLLVTDPFGFTCTRNAATRSHTWVGNESVVRSRGTRIGGRSVVESMVNP